MKARPILFSPPMVRALLDGRKTQTRRIIKPQPEHRQVHEHKGETIYDGEHRMWCWNDLVLDNLIDFPTGEDRRTLANACPYGHPGDLLWVRESWWNGTALPGCGSVKYRADGELNEFSRQVGGGWKPSIHMPRWASRLTLELTEVRVQRLQEINIYDSQQEGIDVGPLTDTGCKMAYANIWEAINGNGPWNANPWVWVLSFHVHQQNIDEFLKARAA